MGVSRSPAERAAARARLFPYGIADVTAKPIQKHPHLRLVVPDPAQEKAPAAKPAIWHFVSR